jgi:hypothetical protein
MATINSNPRPAYMYDSETSQWYQISGKADTGSSYSWSGTHDFSNSVTMDLALKAKGGVNNFLNPSIRDSAITSPVIGLVCFLKQNSDGATINDLQYYNGTSWISVIDPPFEFNQQSSSYTLVITDANKMVELSAGGTLTIPPESEVDFPIGTAIDILQTGTSQVTITAGVDVTINYTPGLKMRTRWSSATVIKRGSNLWLAVGDLVV